ncbi:MAG: CrcB family protein [Hamadaea sp.]|uniref:fluoride efflux transporter FluC n=1 Tax=Hamadaea sp. TaxID=2024425 RepID=UPI00181EE3EC|nr:CrcB family protein [Hamadaea sp.]NUR73857.1 CrcB family protein [Hamadaea sp.]NUT18978.1 CrcB family protein [Hamadaea sp.]
MAHTGARVSTRSADDRSGPGPFATWRRRPAGVPWSVLGVISLGGVLGASARFGLTGVFPGPPGGFPWTVFAINVTGCLLIGALTVAVTDVWPAQRLVRPFLGTGVLGGYTTFSTYVVDAQHLIDRGRPGTALAYLGLTLIAALLATWAGVTVTRTLTARRRTGEHA